MTCSDLAALLSSCRHLVNDPVCGTSTISVPLPYYDRTRVVLPFLSAAQMREFFKSLHSCAGIPPPFHVTFVTGPSGCRRSLLTPSAPR